MTALELAEFLRRTSPEVEAIVAEHIEDFEGEVLAHLLLPDVLRHMLAVASDEENERLLAVIAERLTNGDEYDKEAIRDSFLEHWGGWPGELELRPKFPPILESTLREIEERYAERARQHPNSN